jgi:molecular chaperone GrpE
VDALTRLIDGLDFSREEFYDLYSATPAARPSIPELDNEVWANVSALTADLTRVRGELARLRNGVETLRMPAVEAIGLDKLAETMRSIEARLKPLTPQPGQQRPAEDDAKVMRVLKELLVVADTLERVLELMESQPGSVSDSVATGLRSVYQLLIDNFGRAGVKQAPLTGPFDPHIHLAVGTEPNEALPSGHISRVLQRGYYYNQQVLRTGQVVVVKNAG